MGSESGTAKAKETLRDHSSEQRDNRENSAATARSSAQKVDMNQAQNGRTGASTAQAQRIDSSIPSQRSGSQNTSYTANVSVNSEDRSLYSNFNSKVANRAYELYERNGANHGDDLYHWLQAESEMLTRIPEIQRTDSTYSVVTPLDGFSAEEISVTVEPNRALILADSQHANGEPFEPSEGAVSSRHPAYFVMDWPGPVDPSTATAQIKQGNLVLTVKRADAGSDSE